jgi:hypothetical protein
LGILSDWASCLIERRILGYASLDGNLNNLEKAVNRQAPSRPSLKITRQASRIEANDVVFEIWNPFIGCYQPAASLEKALRRVDELASLIRQMWLQRHAKQSALADVPEVRRTDDVQWAEFRINATEHRSYDTRRSDSPGWMRVTGLDQAAEMTCAGAAYTADCRHVATRLSMPETS